MTRKSPPRDLGASVRARLTDRARVRKENVQLVLTRYAIERLLYRLSISRYRNQFVLKGAMLFSLWAPVPYRSTGDLDLLGSGNPAPERMADIFRDVLSAKSDDGVIFNPETLQYEAARPEDDYSGVRLTLMASIAGARLPVQIDIGFGDIVTPHTHDIEYPSLLDMPPPRLSAYPCETVVAEKFQAIVELGMPNSRMKDFFDLWALSETFAFEGQILAQAIGATFERRKTELPSEAPIALTTAFADNRAKQAQWQGFVRRTAFALSPLTFSETIERVSRFVMPPARALRSKVSFAVNWRPSGPWL